MKKYGDMVCGGIGVAIALIMFILSVEIRIKEGDAIGAAFLPQIVSVIVFALSAVLVWRGWQSSRIQQENSAAVQLANTKGVVLMMGCCLLYAYLLKPLGFIIDSAVFLYVSLCLMSKKEETNYIRFGIITVIAVMAIYLIFTQFFGIRLPKGIL